jgi:L-fuculose-phosphate aldolase
MSTQEMRRSLIAAACELDAAGLMPNKSGNLSCRVAEGILITPSAIAYCSLAPEDLVVLAQDATVIEGRHKPSSETPFHTSIYAARPEINAIVHTHSPKATALACARRGIPAFHYMIALAGANDIPCIEYATFGTPELARNVVEGLQGRKAALISNHGTIAAGRHLAEAKAITLEIENLAACYLELLSAGLTPVLLDEAEMKRVRQQFANYR